MVHVPFDVSYHDTQTQIITYQFPLLLIPSNLTIHLESTTLFLQFLHPSIPPLLTLKSPWRNRQNHHKTTNNQGPGHPRNQHNGTPTCGELPPYNIMLGLKVAMKPNKQNENRDADEYGAEGLADVAEAGLG
jgi:hypothetical protein